MFFWQSKKDLIRKNIDAYKDSKERKYIRTLALLLALFLFYQVAFYESGQKDIASFLLFLDSLEQSSGFRDLLFKVVTNVYFIVGNLIIILIERELSGRFLIKKTEREIDLETEKVLENRIETIFDNPGKLFKLIFKTVLITSVLAGMAFLFF